MQPRDHLWWDSGIGWVKHAVLGQAEEGGVVAYKDGYRSENSRVSFSGEVGARSIEDKL